MRNCTKKRSIIIAIDSFKGCITSEEANEAARSGILAALPDCKVQCIHMADGGEGWLTALRASLKTHAITITTHDPRMRPIRASYLISNDGRKAFIEMATASGLTLLSETERNPLETTTYGTGEMVRDALEKGCQEIVIGLGGSATNDAGMGMMQAIGMRAYDKQNTEIRETICGKHLQQIHRIDLSLLMPEAKKAKFILACDVSNPFYGSNGAAAVYAPQKGATNEMVASLDKGLQHVAKILKETTGKDCQLLPGAGAAGGMGGGLWALLNANYSSGIELLLQLNRFDELLSEAALVITGEGRSDKQTLMGKAAYGILQHAQKKGVPVALLSGQIANEKELLDAGFAKAQSIHPTPLPLYEAMKPNVARRHLTLSAYQLLRQSQALFET